MIEVLDTTLEQRANHQKSLEVLALMGPAVFLERLIPRDVVATQYASFTETNGRNFLLLRVLVEVQKAGMAMGRCHRTVAELRKPNVQKDSVDRVCLESMVDEISLWQRKLSEALVLLINFASTNDHAFYHHFLLIHERQCQRFNRMEQTQFFGSPNEVTNRQIADIERQIESAENARPELKSCWYINRDRKWDLSSFNQQLKAALSNSESMEQRALGYTYAKGFGESSGNIHFSPLRPEDLKSSDRLDVGIAFCGLLAAAIINRAHALTNTAPEKINAAILSSLKQGPGITPTSGRANVGDFVLVEGPAIGTVEEIAVGPFGYEQYRVKYVSDRPYKDIASDWFTAFDLVLFCRKSELVQTLQEMLGRIQADDPPYFDPPVNDAEIAEALSQAMAEMWRRGLGDNLKKHTAPG
jgi:hypothetical protein